MHRTLQLSILSLLYSCAGVCASAQATSTASRLINPSFFSAASGVATGLDSGRNISLTAGLDLALPPVARLEPALEYRAMFPIQQGHVDSLKNNLIGLRFSTRFGPVHAYGDLLAGRGETTYANGGYQVPHKPVFYNQSSSNVFCAGGGTDIFFAEHFAVKIDLQIQHYSSPVTPSGQLNSETASIGLVYVLRLGHRTHL